MTSPGTDADPTAKNPWHTDLHFDRPFIRPLLVRSDIAVQTFDSHLVHCTLLQAYMRWHNLDSTRIIHAILHAAKRDRGKRRAS